MTRRSDFRVDFEEAAKTLNLSSHDFSLVSLHEYERILVSILDRFTNLGKKGLNYGCGVHSSSPMPRFTLTMRLLFFQNLYLQKRRFGLLLRIGEAQKNMAIFGSMREQSHQLPKYWEKCGDLNTTLSQKSLTGY